MYYVDIEQQHDLEDIGYKMQGPKQTPLFPVAFWYMYVIMWSAMSKSVLFESKGFCRKITPFPLIWKIKILTYLGMVNVPDTKKHEHPETPLDPSLASPRFPKEPGLLPRSAPTLLVSWTISEGIVRPRANPGILVKELDMARILSVYSRTPKKVKR